MSNEMVVEQGAAGSGGGIPRPGGLVLGGGEGCLADTQYWNRVSSKRARVDGWTDGRTDEWRDGRTNKYENSFWVLMCGGITKFENQIRLMLESYGREL